MQKRMSIFRHDSRHQLRLLSELIQQGDDEAALDLPRYAAYEAPGNTAAEVDEE